jgi:hypothetical protein
MKIFILSLFILVVFFEFTSGVVAQTNVGSKLIILDPGHTNPDKFGEGKADENILNLQIAAKAKSLLEANGYSVQLTRASGEGGRNYYQDLQDRVDLANNSRANIYVSVHLDNKTGAKAKQITAFYRRPNDSESRRLGKNVSDALAEQLSGYKSTNPEPGDYYVLNPAGSETDCSGGKVRSYGSACDIYAVQRGLSMPGIIQEIFPGNVSYSTLSNSVDSIALGYCNGIAQYLDNKTCSNSAQLNSQASSSPRVSCPVEGGKIITPSYDANPVSGHCGRSYGYSCQCGTTGRRAKAIDIDTSADQDVVLPTIEGKNIIWYFMEALCAGTGTHPNCADSNGGTGAMYTFKGTESANPSERWYIQFVHMNQSALKLKVGGDYEAGQVVGKTDGTAHVHAVLGRNLNEQDGRVTGVDDCGPGWLPSDFMCDPSKQPPQNQPQNQVLPNNGTKSEASFCTKVGNPTTPMPEVCRSPAPGGQSVSLPEGTASCVGNAFYCQGDPKWSGTCFLAAAGCGPTSMAIVLSSFGDTMTPPEVDAIFQRRGWRPCDDAGSKMPAAIQTLLPEMGYTYKYLNGEEPLNLQVAKEYLEKGYLIIGSVFPHIFVVDGVDVANNKVHLRDPANCNPAGSWNSNSAPWTGASGKSYSWYYAYAVKKETAVCSN